MIELQVALQYYVQTYLGIAVCMAMLWWGGGPERAMALVWLIGFQVFEFIFHTALGLVAVYDRVDWFHAADDASVMVLVLLIALFANRLYFLWIAGFQMLSVSAHLARGTIDGFTQLGYAVLSKGPSWLMLATMMIGFKCHLDRRRKYGPYRDWRWQARSGDEPGNGL